MAELDTVLTTGYRKINVTYRKKRGSGGLIMGHPYSPVLPIVLDLFKPDKPETEVPETEEQTVQTPILDNLQLVRIAQLKQLQEKFDLPVETLVSWWGPMNTYSDPDDPDSRSLYERLFYVNKTTGEPIDEVFLLNNNRTELDNPSEKISHYLENVVGALGSRDADINLLLEEGGLLDTLTLENLSKVHSHVSFARAIKLSVADLLALRNMSGIDPFKSSLQVGSKAQKTGLFTRSTLDFVELLEKINQSGFSVGKLEYLLRYTSKTVSAFQPSDEQIAQILQTLHTNVKAIPLVETPLEDTADGASTRELLAVILGEAKIDEAVNLIRSGKDLDSNSKRKRGIFIKKNFASFLDIDEAKKRLIEPHDENDTPQKRFSYVLNALQPYVQKRNAIIQYLAGVLEMDASTAEVLLYKVVQATSDEHHPAIDVFLEKEFLEPQDITLQTDTEKQRKTGCWVAYRL